MSGRVVLVMLAVAGVSAAIGVGLAAGEASGPTVIPYYEDLNAKQNGFAAFKATPVDKGNASKAAGENVFFTSALRSRRGGPVIGRNVAQCQTSGFGVDLCRGVVFLKGRGTLTFDGYASSSTGAHTRTIAIVGGTGEFAGATGSMVSEAKPDSGGGLEWRIVLVG